jgi:membrane protease YdiL (CAAX protease family)
MTVFFGPIVGVVAAVANAALSQLNDVHEQKEWYPLNEKTVTQLENYWENAWPLFTIQIILGIVTRILDVAVHPAQRGVVWVVSKLSSPWTALYAVFRAAIVAPFIEETIFRGFLQEKVRDIQAYVWGQDSDHVIHKIGRVAIQAVIFGAAHLHSSHDPATNLLVFVVTGMLGFYWGLRKEKEGNLWGATARHAHANGALSARLIVRYA